MATHRDLGNQTYNAWREFLRTAETWSRQDVENHQTSELQRVLSHAYRRSSSWRRLLDEHGVSPTDIRSLADLTRLPFVDRRSIQADLDGFSVPDLVDGYVTTGGSTGVPLGLYRDKEAMAKELASKAHQYARIGWREGDRQMVFRGTPIDRPDHIEFVDDLSELRCSSYYLVADIMKVYARRAWEYRPDWIRCYPSSGYLFARWLRESGATFPPVKGLLCASENLYPFQQRFLAETFRTRVFSHYGHYELAVLAGYCESSDAYHVLPQYGIAELIGSDGRTVVSPGGVGEIVGTSFLMMATPLIRYRTGDIAVLKSSTGCESCGRPYQVWERIDGRVHEFAVGRTGRLVSMTAVNFHDDTFDDIAQFQFVQRERGVLEFRLVPRVTWRADNESAVRARLLPKLGDDFQLTFSTVDRIEPTHRGKHRFLVQTLSVGHAS